MTLLYFFLYVLSSFHPDSHVVVKNVFFYSYFLKIYVLKN